MKSRIDIEYSSMYLVVTVIIVLFLVPVMVNVSIPVMMNVPIMADFEGGHKGAITNVFCDPDIYDC